MTRILMLLALIISLNSCSLFKKTTSNKDLSVHNKDSTSKSKIKSKIDSTGETKVVDKSKTIIEKSIDTTISTKKDSLKADVKLPYKKPLDTTFKSNNLSVHVTYNPEDNVLKFKVDKEAEDVHLKFNQKETKENNIETTTKVNKTSKSVEVNKTIVKSKDKVKQKTKISEPDNSLISNVFIILIVGILIVVAFIFSFKNGFKIKNL